MAKSKDFFKWLFLFVSAVIFLVVAFLFVKNKQDTNLEDKVVQQNKEKKEFQVDQIIGTKVVDYPDAIKDVCQEVEIKLKVENNSESPIGSVNFKNGEYSLRLEAVSDSQEPMLIDTVAGPVVDLKFSDFETIPSGEVGTLTYKPVFEIERTLGGETETLLENSFSSVKENGEYKLRVVLEDRTGDENKILGQTETFSVDVQVLSEDGVYKACH